ncbi:MAG: translation initiation factor IF-2 [Candidatus Bipolaricaulota bacterium]|nr:translation initiation factor IF-2 [Candidatus Bipolaricaulota bacterium]
MAGIRKRIYEIAAELGVSSKDLITKLAEMGMPNLKAANSVDEEECTLIVNLYREQVKPTEEAPSPPAAAPEARPAARPVKKGMPRPPIVSVLGHIDHGKTTLLDAIRHSHLASKEAGGITQTIGAYQADLHGQKITFIDTPGHKAFTGMRARGAKATDIAVLVVAADDGVMAQTVEAIDHIRAAGIPLIVAINKIDKPNADINKVMTDLAKQGLTPEAWGGQTITVSISALNEEHIDELLEMILLVAEMENLRADPSGPLEAIVIESHLTSGRGPVTTAVIRDGTLHEKDCVVAGSTYGRVKALIDENGKRVPEAGPGKAVEILGLEEVAQVGTALEVKKDANEAKEVAAARRGAQAAPRRVRPELNVEDLFRVVAEEVKLSVVLKAASTGALEAARREIDGIHVESVQLDVLHAGVGTISESDVLLASTIGGTSLVVGFGVKVDPKASKLADAEGVIVLPYDIIYDLIDELGRALKRMVAPEYAEQKLGEAEVRQVFKIPHGMVAGCYVTQGKITRSARLHVMRGDREVFTGEIASLRRFENDAREVQADRECGIRVKDFDQVEVGDRLVFFTMEEVTH